MPYILNANSDRSRWYGLRVGDRVVMRFSGTERKGVVTKLHSMDNNGCTIKLSTGVEIKGVCEWCDIVQKVEDRK